MGSRLPYSPMRIHDGNVPPHLNDPDIYMDNSEDTMPETEAMHVQAGMYAESRSHFEKIFIAASSPSFRQQPYYEH